MGKSIGVRMVCGGTTASAVVVVVGLSTMESG